MFKENDICLNDQSKSSDLIPKNIVYVMNNDVENIEHHSFYIYQPNYFSLSDTDPNRIIYRELPRNGHFYGQ